jgi:hypothetical protein
LRERRQPLLLPTLRRLRQVLRRPLLPERARAGGAAGPGAGRLLLLLLVGLVLASSSSRLGG